MDRGIHLKKGPMTQAAGMKHAIIPLTRVHFDPSGNHFHVG